MDSVGEELERLARLRASGDLSDEEYELLKSRVIDSTADTSTEEPVERVSETKPTTQPASETVKQEATSEGFFADYKKGLQNASDYSGRATVREFWSLYLINAVIVFIVGIIVPVVGIVLAFLALLTGLSVGVRRLHDQDRSGWFMLISFIPLGVLVLLAWATRPGTKGSNRYGPDPLNQLAETTDPESPDQEKFPVDSNEIIQEVSDSIKEEDISEESSIVLPDKSQKIYQPKEQPTKYSEMNPLGRVIYVLILGFFTLIAVSLIIYFFTGGDSDNSEPYEMWTVVKWEEATRVSTESISDIKIIDFKADAGNSEVDLTWGIMTPNCFERPPQGPFWILHTFGSATRVGNYPYDPAKNAECSTKDLTWRFKATIGDLRNGTINYRFNLFYGVIGGDAGAVSSGVVYAMPGKHK